MRNVTTKKLPHGTIPIQEIRDERTRKVVMQVNENVRAVDERLRVVEAAVRELQRRD